VIDFSLRLSLKFEGNSADNHQIDLYDVSQSLIGFQRSLALTTHLVINNEIITQAPSLKGAAIYATPPRPGSWEIFAHVLGELGISAFLYKFGTAPRDTPLGHLVSSVYSFAIKKSLGFHVDFDQTLGEQYEKIRETGVEVPTLTESRVDSLIEKIEPAVRELHRPIFASHTAKTADISASLGGPLIPIGEQFTESTYEYMRFLEQGSYPEIFHGRVSSFNINTFSGRIFIREFGRPVPFSLAESVRNKDSIILTTFSLAENAKDQRGDRGDLVISAFVNKGRSGHIRKLFVVSLREDTDIDY